MSLRHNSPIPLVFPLWCQFRATMWGEGRCGLATTHKGYPLTTGLVSSDGMQGNTTQLTSKRGRICHLSEELIQEENSVLQEKRVVMC